MNRQKLTKRAVDAARCPDAGEDRLWDTELSGFCLRLYGSGRKVYAVKYRVKGRQRWLTIGKHGAPWTPDDAREAAATALLMAEKGDDPADLKRVKDDLTVNQLIDLYLTAGKASKPDKRETSWLQDASNLRRHVKPTIGRRLASGLTKPDITRMVTAITNGDTATVEKTKKRGKAVVTGGAGIAARCFSTARAMFAWGIEEGHLAGPNPCAGVKLAARADVERFLTADQLVAILKAVEDLKAEGRLSERHAAIFNLLALTGARRTEIAGLKWSEVDLDRAILNLPPERTKAGGNLGNRRIALSSAALAVLRRLREHRGKEAYVFPAARGATGHTKAEGKIWRETVLPRAKLTGVRIHDLRHTYASLMLADGAPLGLIGKALGHANSRATERYAKLADDPLRAMAEKMGERFGGRG